MSNKRHIIIIIIIVTAIKITMFVWLELKLGRASGSSIIVTGLYNVDPDGSSDWQRSRGQSDGLWSWKSRVRVFPSSGTSLSCSLSIFTVPFPRQFSFVEYDGKWSLVYIFVINLDITSSQVCVRSRIHCIRTSNIVITRIKRARIVRTGWIYSSWYEKSDVMPCNRYELHSQKLDYKTSFSDSHLDRMNGVHILFFY